MQSLLGIRTVNFGNGWTTALREQVKEELTNLAGMHIPPRHQYSVILTLVQNDTPLVFFLNSGYGVHRPYGTAHRRCRHHQCH